MRILIGNGMMRVTKLDVNKKYNKKTKEHCEDNCQTRNEKENVKVRS